MKNIPKTSFLVAVLVAVLVCACAPQMSIQERNPGVKFMGQKEAKEFLLGNTFESPQVVVTYKPNGVAIVYVKGNNEYTGSWKVQSDGKVSIYVNNEAHQHYISADGKKSYGLDGSIGNTNKK